MDENDIISGIILLIVGIFVFLGWGYVYFGGAVNIQDNNWLLAFHYFIGFIWMCIWLALFGFGFVMFLGVV